MSENQKSGTLLLGMVLGLLLAGVVGLLTWLIVVAGTARVEEVDDEDVIVNETEELLDLEDLDLDVEDVTNASSEAETPAVKTEKVYAGYWEADDDPNYIVSEISLSDVSGAKQVFSQKDVRSQVIVAGEKMIYATVDANQRMTLYTRDLSGTTSAPLFTLAQKHWVGGLAASADGRTLYFSDECSATCSADAESAVTVIKSYDLTTKVENVLYTEKGKWQAFKTIRALLDADTLLLGEGYEGTEGSMYIPRLYMLELSSGTLTTVETKTATSISASPDGTKLAYTTFAYDENTDAAVSMIVVKSLSGGTDTLIQTGTDVQYRDIRWVDQDTLVVWAQTINSIRFELGYVITGEKQMQTVDLDDRTMTTLDLGEEPDDVAGAAGGKVFYNTADDLKVYDLQTRSRAVALNRVGGYYFMLGNR